MYVAANTDDLGAAARAERLRCGLNQTQVAALAGTTRQWLSRFEKGHDGEAGITLAVLGALHITIVATTDRHRGTQGSGATWMTASDAARAIRAELRRGDDVFALSLLAHALADLRVVESHHRQRSFAAPPSTGDHRWDTLVAGAYANAAIDLGNAPPEWTDTARLDPVWWPDDEARLRDRAEAETPDELARRGIVLARRALVAL